MHFLDLSTHPVLTACSTHSSHRLREQGVYCAAVVAPCRSHSEWIRHGLRCVALLTAVLTEYSRSTHGYCFLQQEG